LCTRIYVHLQIVVGINQRDTIAIISEYNLEASFLTKNRQISARTKLDICHHYVRELLERKLLELRFQISENNLSDMMTIDSSVRFFGKTEDDEIFVNVFRKLS
jgi:hypothetical protein